MAEVGNPRLLIFGCGYVGSRLAELAITREWKVCALTRNDEKARALTARGIHVVRADLASDDWHSAVAREQDVVLNAVSSGGGGLEGYRHSYLDGTRSILRWAARGVPATFIYTSSTSVYPQNAGEVVTEDSPVAGDGSEAAPILLEAEQLVRESSCFRRWFILRLAGIYGLGRHYLLDQLRGGATVFPGTGTHRLNLAHRDDIVAAILACATAPESVRNQIFNVAGDTAATKAEVTRWLADKVGCAAAPGFARDGVDLPPNTERIRGRSGPVPDRLISNARLKQVLGWQPQFPNFRDGYEQIFDEERDSTGKPT